MLTCKMATKTLSMTKSGSPVFCFCQWRERNFSIEVSGDTPFRVLPEDVEGRLKKTLIMEEGVILPHPGFMGHGCLQYAGVVLGEVLTALSNVLHSRKKCS